MGKAWIRCPACGTDKAEVFRIEACAVVKVTANVEGDHQTEAVDPGAFNYYPESVVMCDEAHGGCGHQGELQDFEDAAEPVYNCPSCDFPADDEDQLRCRACGASLVERESGKRFIVWCEGEWITECDTLEEAREEAAEVSAGRDAIAEVRVYESEDDMDGEHVEYVVGVPEVQE